MSNRQTRRSFLVKSAVTTAGVAAGLQTFSMPQKGSILLDGMDIMTLRKQDLRQLVGIVQQDVFLFARTISENIAFGKPEASDQELYHAAKRAHIYDYIMSLPEGFDSLVGERGDRLPRTPAPATRLRTSSRA